MGRRLLEGDGGASLFELSLRLLSGLLVGAFEHGARSTVNDSLRLTEAEAGEGAHLLDDLDLLVTGGLEDDVEGILLLDLFSSGASATGAGAATATGAAAVTSKVSSNFFTNSLSSMSVSSLNASSSSSVDSFAMIFSLVFSCTQPLGSASRRMDYAADSCFSRSASTVRTACDSGALNRYAAPNSEALKAPASFASRTSRDSRSASLPTSSAVSGLPSK